MGGLYEALPMGGLYEALPTGAGCWAGSGRCFLGGLVLLLEDLGFYPVEEALGSLAEGELGLPACLFED